MFSRLSRLFSRKFHTSNENRIIFKNPYEKLDEKLDTINERLCNRTETMVYIQLFTFGYLLLKKC